METPDAVGEVNDTDGTASAPGLIDWETALETAARLSRTHRADTDRSLAAAVARVEAEVPVFRNKDYPLSPLPLLVEPTAAARTAERLEAYVELLEKVVRIHRHDEPVRRWYGLSDAAEALIDAEAESGDPARIHVCRLDGYLEQGGERLRVLENNADAPAGTLFTPRVHAAVAAVLQSLGIRLPPHAERFRPAETALLDLLTAGLTDARRQQRTPCVAVLQPHGKENRESLEMITFFRAEGVEALVVDPRQIAVSGGHARVGRRRIDVCWNKVNTVLWEKMLDRDPELLKLWLRVLRDTDLWHVNPFAARYVAESKLTLALLQEEEFAHHFDEAERRLVAGLLPRTRRLRADDDTLHRVLDEQHRYVVKEPYDIRGDGVTVGRAVTRDAWSKAVAEGVARPAVVQGYVAPSAYPVVRTGARPQIITMPISLDTYVLGGKAAFFGSKASLAARVNLFQGGQKLAVHVPETGKGDATP
ncbi:circularly permuted type 2 ATP-grasp protein [Streptomyces somaliensis]|uniref:circularly permuted type 2 ATP-grasp protein n=1 Tax=Streptomyces somaliensis TaxID=78355 RepID=UPI0020CE2E86|nr:circularly permuted type 2 ATP-grasp protein [Streptomyces somaliensis]MCP9943856.1 circularly permuted type 2 ATP-grasp protein [Streptomyces somaliensis]MCP9975745.1 circularly permuted type 2 ATP-grasp protein [Streptomyces somaliensis]